MYWRLVLIGHWTRGSCRLYLRWWLRTPSLRWWWASAERWRIQHRRSLQRKSQIIQMGRHRKTLTCTDSGVCLRSRRLLLSRSLRISRAALGSIKLRRLQRHNETQPWIIKSPAVICITQQGTGRTMLVKEPRDYDHWWTSTGQTCWETLSLLVSLTHFKTHDFLPTNVKTNSCERTHFPPQILEDEVSNPNRRLSQKTRPDKPLSRRPSFPAVRSNESALAVTSREKQLVWMLTV